MNDREMAGVQCFSQQQLILTLTVLDPVTVKEMLQQNDLKQPPAGNHI